MDIKENVKIVSNDPPCKDWNGNVILETCIWWIFKNVKEIVMFLGLKVFSSDNSYVFLQQKSVSHLCRETIVEKFF